MPGPRPAPVDLTVEEGQQLEALVRRHSAPQHLVVRARIVLAAGAGLANAAVARQVGVDVDTARLWRQRWLAGAGVALADLGVGERLGDAPRSGRPARITAEQYCPLVALACAAPSTVGRPISQWSGRAIAAAAVAQGIVETISPRHAARLLTRGACSRTACALG